MSYQKDFINYLNTVFNINKSMTFNEFSRIYSLWKNEYEEKNIEIKLPGKTIKLFKDGYFERIGNIIDSVLITKKGLAEIVNK